MAQTSDGRLGLSEDLFSLQDVLHAFNNSINEEQAWSVCYQCACYFSLNHSQEKYRDIYYYGTVAIKIRKDGEVVIDSTSTTLGSGKGPPRNRSSFSLSREFKTSITQVDAVQALGSAIYKALDYGLSESEEPHLGGDLEEVIEYMTHPGDDDEGIDVERDSDDSQARDHYMWHEIADYCVRHLSSGQDAGHHYKAVCRALATEAKELITFLDNIASGQERLEKDKNSDADCIEDLERSDWARLWVQIMRDLRRGVRLKKVEQVNLAPMEFELTPFEILLEDIRTHRYKLNRILVNGDIPPKVKSDAHAVILDFIRSRPPLKPVKQRMLSSPPKRELDEREKLMLEIQKPHQLRPVRKGKILVRSPGFKLGSSEDDTDVAPARKVIRPVSAFEVSDSDESYMSDDSTDGGKHHVKGPVLSPLSPVSPVTQSGSWKQTVVKDLVTGDRPHPLTRRHTIMVCEANAGRKVSAVQREHVVVEEADEDQLDSSETFTRGHASRKPTRLVSYRHRHEQPVVHAGRASHVVSDVVPNKPLPVTGKHASQCLHVKRHSVSSSSVSSPVHELSSSRRHSESSPVFYSSSPVRGSSRPASATCRRAAHSESRSRHVEHSDLPVKHAVSSKSHVHVEHSESPVMHVLRSESPVMHAARSESPVRRLSRSETFHTSTTGRQTVQSTKSDVFVARSDSPCRQMVRSDSFPPPRCSSPHAHPTGRSGSPGRHVSHSVLYSSHDTQRKLERCGSSSQCSVASEHSEAPSSSASQSKSTGWRIERSKVSGKASRRFSLQERHSVHVKKEGTETVETGPGSKADRVSRSEAVPGTESSGRSRGHIVRARSHHELRPRVMSVFKSDAGHGHQARERPESARIERTSSVSRERPGSLNYRVDNVSTGSNGRPESARVERTSSVSRARPRSAIYGVDKTFTDSSERSESAKDERASNVSRARPRSASYRMDKTFTDSSERSETARDERTSSVSRDRPGSARVEKGSTVSSERPHRTHSSIPVSLRSRSGSSVTEHQAAHGDSSEHSDTNTPDLQPKREVKLTRQSAIRAARPVNIQDIKDRVRQLSSDKDALSKPERAENMSEVTSDSRDRTPEQTSQEQALPKQDETPQHDSAVSQHMTSQQTESAKPRVTSRQTILLKQDRESQRVLSTGQHVTSQPSESTNQKLASEDALPGERSRRSRLTVTNKQEPVLDSTGSGQTPERRQTRPVVRSRSEVRTRLEVRPVRMYGQELSPAKSETSLDAASDDETVPPAETSGRISIRTPTPESKPVRDSSESSSFIETVTKGLSQLNVSELFHVSWEPELPRDTNSSSCTAFRPVPNKWQNPIECLSLTLEEVTHIRIVLTKAELESLISDQELYLNVSKGKVCFTCKKTKFSLFGQWGTKCKFCHRSVCNYCLRKVNVPTEHFEKIPVYTLSPVPISPEVLEALKVYESSGSAPHSPEQDRKATPVTTAENKVTRRRSLQRSHTIGVGPRPPPNKALLKGPQMSICCDCKTMIMEIIRASRTSVALVNKGKTRTHSTGDEAQDQLPKAKEIEQTRPKSMLAQFNFKSFNFAKMGGGSDA